MSQSDRLRSQSRPTDESADEPRSEMEIRLAQLPLRASASVEQYMYHAGWAAGMAAAQGEACRSHRGSTDSQPNRGLWPWQAAAVCSTLAAAVFLLLLLRTRGERITDLPDSRRPHGRSSARAERACRRAER